MSYYVWSYAIRKLSKICKKFHFLSFKNDFLQTWVVRNGPDEYIFPEKICVLFKSHWNSTIVWCEQRKPATLSLIGCQGYRERRAHSSFKKRTSPGPALVFIIDKKKKKGSSSFNMSAPPFGGWQVPMIVALRQNGHSVPSDIHSLGIRCLHGLEQGLQGLVVKSSISKSLWTTFHVLWVGDSFIPESENTLQASPECSVLFLSLV